MTREVRTALVAAALLLGTALGSAAAESAAPASAGAARAMSPQRQREVLRQALSAFDEAVATGRTDPARARELYQQAAAGFHALADAGVRNPALEYNLGNTYVRLGELGPALLHYRRAQRLAPRDAKLAANLAHARRQVEPFIAPPGGERLWRRLLFWHYATSSRERFWAAAVLNGAGWLLLLVRLRRPVGGLVAVGTALMVLGLACSLSLAWELRGEARAPAAVVITPGSVLRLGRGEGYEPALGQPLGAGMELRLLQQRGDWVEVRLANDQTGWLPAAVVARI